MIVIIIYLLIGALVAGVLAAKEFIAFKDVGFCIIAYPLVLTELFLRP